MDVFADGATAASIDTQYEADAGSRSNNYA